MQEALTLFDSICNSRWFVKTSIVRPSFSFLLIPRSLHPTCLLSFSLLPARFCYASSLPPPHYLPGNETKRNGECSPPLGHQQILFLNKIDLFAEKLPRSPLGDYFPDYTGGDNYDAACDYL
jgi:hypothetical protein